MSPASSRIGSMIPTWSAKAVKVWTSIREPRQLKMVYAIYYSASILAGFITVFHPPRVIINNTEGPWLSLAFSVLIALGGMASVVAVFPGWWWLERLGNYSALIALLIFAIVVGARSFEALGTTAPAQVWVALLATGFYVVRHLMIKDYSFEPRADHENKV